MANDEQRPGVQPGDGSVRGLWTKAEDGRYVTERSTLDANGYRPDQFPNPVTCKLHPMQQLAPNRNDEGELLYWYGNVGIGAGRLAPVTIFND